MRSNDLCFIFGSHHWAVEERADGMRILPSSLLLPIAEVDLEQPIADAYKILFGLLQKHNYSRNMFVSTASYRAPQDVFSFLYSLMIWSVYLFFNPAYTEINAMTPLMTALPVAEMNWTVFRVPMLKDGPAGPVKAEFIGKGVGMSLDRKALAEWLLKEMEEGKWIGKCPAVSNA